MKHSIYRLVARIGIVFTLGIFLNGLGAKEVSKINPESKDKPIKIRKSKSTTVPKEYIVKLNAGIDPNRIKELVPNIAISKLEKISDDTYHVVYENEPGLENLVQAGKKSGFVEYVEPNRIYKAF